MDRLALFISLVACSPFTAACERKPATPPPEENAEPVEEKKQPETVEPVAAPDPLDEKIAQFVVAELTTDIAQLPESEKKVLQKLIEASRLLDPVFDRQAWAGLPAMEAALRKDESADAKKKLEYLRIMRGPWDRQDHHAPFATEQKRPAGGGFYPEDMTAEEFRAWIDKHPEQEEAFESLFTVIRRTEDGGLEAVPYREAYKEWLVPAAEKLEEAAALTSNESLKTFLESRAAAFSSDDYYQSDKDWMDLDGLVEVTIGPYEVYEDELLGLKASFESFVTVTDPKASADLAKYKELLPEMEKNLPIPDEVKTVRGAESPIRVVDVVFTSGDARKSVQTIAFNLPNDERVRKEKGAKKVLLRNLIETKFEKIMRPIAEQIIDEEQLKYLSADAFFNETLFHELSHSLGPAFTTKDGEKVEVRLALESAYSAIEECKADVMGAYNILFMIQKGHFPKDFREKLLVSYFAGLFRSVRFGVSEAHGKGAAVQINRFLRVGAARFDAAAGRFTVDLPALEKAISDLVRDLCLVQHEGDKSKAEAMLNELGVLSEPIKAALDKTSRVPVDIRPVYPLAGETGPR